MLPEQIEQILKSQSYASFLLQIYRWYPNQYGCPLDKFITAFSETQTHNKKIKAFREISPYATYQGKFRELADRLNEITKMFYK